MTALWSAVDRHAEVALKFDLGLDDAVSARRSGEHDLLILVSVTGAMLPRLHHLGLPGPLESLPWPNDLRRQGVDVDPAEAMLVEERLAEIDEAESRSANHQLFGFAQPLQDDVWSSLRADLLQVGDAAALSRLDNMEHRLLLQIDSDSAVGLEIGDMGRLYVVIPVEDLRSGVFDRCLACVQSC